MPPEGSRKRGAKNRPTCRPRSALEGELFEGTALNRRVLGGFGIRWLGGESVRVGKVGESCVDFLRVNQLRGHVMTDVDWGKSCRRALELRQGILCLHLVFNTKTHNYSLKAMLAGSGFTQTKLYSYQFIQQKIKNCMYCM